MIAMLLMLLHILQSYDRELENLAQIWAANCIFAHDESDNRYIPGMCVPPYRLSFLYILDFH